jgi:CTP:molybdopterin cytidylyltransferase MocA
MFDAVILAAGSGTRFFRSGGSTYKQLAPYKGVPLIRRIVDILVANPLVGGITVVVGEDDACADAIREVLAGCQVAFVRNDRSSVDNNLLSFWKGIEGLQRGVVIVEADCVFEPEDLSALLQATKDDEICWANIGDLSRHSSGGVISVGADGLIDAILILDAVQMKKFKDERRHGMKMYGLTAMGSSALAAYRAKLYAGGARLNRYFHAVAMESFDEFRHATAGMSSSAFSFNTLEEYME